ncbi:TerC family protein [Hamadaea tsunoensis]|uniref:TerC family protein n=1 Tax=Hamadaea tsunoensis TaxID=53368 RepID=UPI000484672B|nr:TerC family protein [Hamadaea tsunoensis]
MELIIGFLGLLALEIVLGIDNIVFISVLSAKLPLDQRDRARKLGIGLALISRLALLGAISWVVRLTEPLFAVAGREFSGQDLVLIFGGLFLLAKSTYEIHDSLEGEEGHANGRTGVTFGGVLVQIMLLDVVFSLDSIITAVGMVSEVWVMAAAIVVSVIIMLVASGPISAFVHRHPSIKMLALSFLLLIGLTLLLDGFHLKIPKGYIYFAMGFSLLVEILNLRVRAKRRAKPVELHERVTGESPEGQDD